MIWAAVLAAVSLVPRPVGEGPAFRPPAPAARTCVAASAPRYGAHVEVFAAGRVVVVPAGLGIPAPRRREGAYVDPAPGGCSSALRTREPTGVVEIATRRAPRLRELFALWHQPLGRHRLAGFHGHVRVAVGGRPWRGAPGAVPLIRHAQVVVQVGPRVVPHPSYRFAPGL